MMGKCACPVDPSPSSPVFLLVHMSALLAIHVAKPSHPVHKSPLPLSLFFSGPNQFTSNLFYFVVPISTHVKCGWSSLHISKCYTEPDTHCPPHMIYLVLVLFSTSTTKLSQNIQSFKVILPGISHKCSRKTDPSCQFPLHSIPFWSQ